MDIASLIKVKRNPKIPDIAPGDTVKVSARIVEGGKERIQVFQGVVIKMRGGGVGASFTVRHVAYGIGVERTFPLYSPLVEKVEVVRQGKVRRAKLYYLRGLSGKAARRKIKRVERKVRGIGEELLEPVMEEEQEAVLEEEVEAVGEEVSEAVAEEETKAVEEPASEEAPEPEAVVEQEPAQEEAKTEESVAEPEPVQEEPTLEKESEPEQKPELEPVMEQETEATPEPVPEKEQEAEAVLEPEEEQKQEGETP